MTTIQIADRTIGPGHQTYVIAELSANHRHDRGEAGALIRLAGEDVPAFLGMRSSPHEIGLADLLAVLRLRGLEPEEVVVLGMQPEVIELGWELSPTVSARLDLLVDMAVSELERWGVTLIAQKSEQMEAIACTK